MASLRGLEYLSSSTESTFHHLFFSGAVTVEFEYRWFPLETVFQMQILSTGCLPSDTQLVKSTFLFFFPWCLLSGRLFSSTINLTGIAINYLYTLCNWNWGTGWLKLCMENKSQNTPECDLGFCPCLRAPCNKAGVKASRWKIPARVFFFWL